MKILLISPLPGIDPPCGDITYTQTLLAHPPDGVEYETYAEALERGTLKEHGNRQALRAARQSRQDVGRETFLTARSRALNLLRRRGILFREPFRFFSVAPGVYDAIHLHVFSARFASLPCPLLVSNAAPLRYVYTEAWRFSPRRVARIEWMETRLARRLGVNINSYRLPQATRVIAFTQFLKGWYAAQDGIPPVDVVPIYLPSVPEVMRGDQTPNRVGFIAKDFEAKGGPTLLEAWAHVRRDRPDAQLVIVGSPPQVDGKEAEFCGITWIPYIPREELLQNVLPSFDVLAYPTRFDGQPLVVLEAMAHGIPVATSDYQAMPELVDFGNAGLVSPVGDAQALAQNILALLDKGQNAVYRQKIKARFCSQYAADAVRPRLRASYEAAIRDFAPGTRAA